MVSIVVPIYNEVETVDELCRRLHSVLAEGRDYEIVFVDDASRRSNGRSPARRGGRAASARPAARLGRGGRRRRTASARGFARGAAAGRAVYPPPSPHANTVGQSRSGRKRRLAKYALAAARLGRRYSARRRSL
jgi:hypothetical protein